MDPTTHAILSEATAFALLSLAVALLLFAYIRHRNPAVRWHAHGNVYSQPYNALDLAVAGMFLALFLAPVLMDVVVQVRTGEGGEPGGAGGGGGENSGATGDLQTGQMERLIYGVLVQSFLIGCLLTYLTVGRGFNPAEIFGLRQMSILRAAVVSLIIFIPVFLLVAASMLVVEMILEETLPEAGPQQLVKTFIDSRSDALRGMIALSAVVVAPLAEEIVFRGFLYPVIKRHTDRFFAAIFTGLIFGIIHYHMPSVVPLWVFGILLAVSYELTGCLWVPIFLHALFNGYQTLMMLYS